MPQRKPKKFCRLTKFLEITDKDLYQTFDDLCLLSLFRTRGTRGITFLYPTSKTYRKKIIDLAYSNTPEKAVDMIKTLILMDYLPSPIDFKNKKDDIPNSLRKKLDVEDADSKGVKLKGGMTLELDTSYVPLRNDDHVVVYKLSGTGELSTTSAPSTMKYSQGKTTGGYCGGSYYGGNISAYKKTISAFVKNIYMSNTENGKDVYKFVLSLLYAKLVRDNDPALIKSVYTGMCASDRATYYNILCPHSDKNPYNIPDEIYEILAKLNTAVWNTSKDELKHFVDNKDVLIKTARGGDYDTSKRDETYKKQTDELAKITNPRQYIDIVKEAYKDDTVRLSKDLLTVYCYLSSVRESEDPNNNSYYENCFLFVMSNIFNDSKKILDGTIDLAYNLTLYGNLLKSDAFLFQPVTSKDPRDSRYTDLNGNLPDPTVNNQLFTIIHNNNMKMYGGSDEIPEELRTLMGGVDGFKTEIQAGMSD